MKLRPELLPPVLDAALVAALARFADRLDGARAGEADAELAQFCLLARMNLTLADFQGIHKGEDPEDFVRRVLFQQHLRPDPYVTVEELAEVVRRVITCADGHDFYLELFLTNCRHPAETDLIYWPSEVSEFPAGREPTAEEIATLALRGAAR